MPTYIYIYVRKQLYKAYGARVIVDQLCKQLDNVKVVFSITEIPNGAFVIPYGAIEATELINKKRFPLNIALIIDAYSLGELSTIPYFIFRKCVPLKDIVSMFLRYIKYKFVEYNVLKHYKKAIIVSWGDRSYFANSVLTKRFFNKIEVIQNGVIIPDKLPERKLCIRPIRIGCLSAWASYAFQNLCVFIETIWSKLPSYDGIELIIAGRFLDKEKMDYLMKYPNIRIVGEVEKLESFYDNIDISLITMVKKSGIINRVLDGFSYKIPVLCHPNSLLAFKDLPDCCYTYRNVDEFISSVNAIRDSPIIAKQKAEEAFGFVKKYHDWSVNYKDLKILIDSFFIE